MRFWLNLTSIEVRFWRLEWVSTLKEWIKTMNRRDLSTNAYYSEKGANIVWQVVTGMTASHACVPSSTLWKKGTWRFGRAADFRATRRALLHTFVFYYHGGERELWLFAPFAELTCVYPSKQTCALTKQTCVLMLVRRRWRWANIKTTQAKHLQFDV